MMMYVFLMGAYQNAFWYAMEYMLTGKLGPELKKMEPLK